MSISGIKDRGAYIAVGDYDEDGFLDLLYASFTRELTALYRNNGNSNRWLRVELVGIESNRDGIGSRLIATSGDLVQMREILGGVGRQQDEKVAHFGLAGRTLVDRLEIRWPSGQIDVLQSIPADRKIRVFEGRAGYQVARPTIWENAPPEVVVENTTTPFAIRIRPRLFEPNAEVTRVSADLSAFGGESAVELEAAGDGTYRLQTTLVVSDSRGPRQVSVAVEQATFLGPRLARLAWSITVAPAVDLPVFEEKSEQSWQVSSRWLKNLSVDPAWDYTPAWSPDGTKILFSSFRGGMDIYQVMRDGSDLHRLTSASLWDWFPSFSPDGTKVVFSTNRDGNGELYVMDADGSNEVRLTDHQEDDGAGTFSPDGTRIVFDSDRDGNREVYVIDADGSNPVRLTNNPANDGHATWSPDGTKILFFSNRDGNNEIYVMNADGSNPVNLTQHAADDSDPDFSPDGSRIAFSSNRDGDNEIYVMNADGSNPVNLTSYPMFDLIPDWSPDGRHLVFARGPGRPDIYILEVEPSDRLVVQADQQRVVNHGRSAVQVSARDGEWQVLYEPEAPVDPAGYEAIRFAIHPGDTEAREGAFFELALDESAKPGPPYTRNNSPSSKIDLLQVARPEARIDLTIRDWQVVQVPLDLLPGVQGSIDAINFFGNLHGTFYLDDVRLVTAASAPRATAVEEGATALPGAFALDQNYPNPFNSGTAIGFDLPQSDHVEMAVFNLAGQKVMNLVEGPRDAGSYTLRWDGRDGRGRSLASGVYLYRLQVGKLVETRKLLLLR